MGVATLITVMTLVQGANLYVEQKIANLGTNVFRIARLPFAVTDFIAVTKAQRNKLHLPGRSAGRGGGLRRIASTSGTSVTSTLNARYRDHELRGHQPLRPHAQHGRRSTRARSSCGRYFTDVEDRHAADVCLIGDR